MGEPDGDHGSHDGPGRVSRTHPDRIDGTATRANRFARASGVLAPAVSLLGIALAVSLTPSFSWAASALSDLGRPGAPVPWLFNGGLVLGGVLALPFAWWRWQRAGSRVGRLTAIGLGGTGLALAGVGLFPSGTDLHFPVAVGFYCLLTYTLFLDGSARSLAGDVRRGVTWIWVGVVHLTGWLLWVVVGVGGLAVPETFGALLFTVWLVASALEGGR